MSDAAARKRRQREREKVGTICLLVECDEIALTEQLLLTGFLAARDVDDRDAIKAALQHVVDLWSQGVTRDGAPFSDLP